VVVAQAVPVRVRPSAFLFFYRLSSPRKKIKKQENALLQNYLPVLIFMILGFGIGLIAPILGYLLSPKDPYPEKLAAYECGFPAFNDARAPFDVRYYLIAILFILFDLETAFLVPWTVTFRQLGWFGMGAMGIFLVLLTVGFIYEWKKGALEWE
jgi:NADH-quinone oxidoreductase subunit A